jgi:hypothetical protein
LATEHFKEDGVAVNCPSGSHAVPMEENPPFRPLPRTGDAVFETFCREGYVSDGAAHAVALLRGWCNNGIFSLLSKLTG